MSEGLRHRLERFNTVMDRLVRTWLPDLSPGAGSGENRRRILIPLKGALSPSLGQEVALALGRPGRDEVVLSYFVEEPPTLAVGQALATGESAARCSLEKAVSVLESHGISARYVVFPARSLASGIDTLASDLDVDFVLHGLDRPVGPAPASMPDRSQIKTPRTLAGNVRGAVASSPKS